MRTRLAAQNLEAISSLAITMKTKRRFIAEQACRRKSRPSKRRWIN